MADVSVKMGVSGISQFKAGMSQAQASVKNVDAALKLNEKQLRANGDAEAYMQQKTALLTSKLQAQKSAVSNAQSALKTMKSSGVDPMSTAYQNMETQLLNAQAAMLDTETELRNLGSASTGAAGKADQLTTSINGISKKMSLDAVISGIDRITDGMEKAAQKAIELGKSIWDNIVDSASYADDVATLATRLGLSTTDVQKMQYVAAAFEAPVEDMGKAWQRTKKSMASDSKEITDMYRELGVATHDVVSKGGKYDPVELRTARDYKDVFWETGEALMRMTDETKREEYAQKLLGKSWDEFIPLFTAGREAYEEAMEAAPAASEKAVEQAAELNDRLNELEASWETLKLEVIGGIAPALTKAADALKGLVDKITEYLQTDEGQEQLQRMSDALGKIFDKLTDFDPEGVIAGVQKVLDGITGAFEWIADNWESVKTGILMIAGAFGVMKLTSLGLTVANLVGGLRTRFGGGAPTATPTTAPPATTPTTVPPATGVLHGGSSAEAIAAAEATHLLGGSGGMGGALGGVGTLTLGGALGGLAVIAGGTIVMGKIVSSMNDAENEAREVSKDIHRFDTLWEQQRINDIPRELSNAMNGVMKDKRLVLQETVRGLLGTEGSSSSVYGQLKWLGHNLNESVFDAFNYTNTSGESRNKLLDMLNMSGDYTPAAAALILRSAGIDFWDERLNGYGQAYQSALRYLDQNWIDMYKNGGFTEGLGIINDFFMKSGTFNENGEWTIPGLEEDLAAQKAAAEAINDAAETMKGMPQDVVAAIQGANFSVNLSLFPGHANGLPYVPFDGYMAMLHRGERVMTARENRNYTNNSNFYFGNVNLNNGLEIEQLTESIDRHNRRKQNGYGG